MKYISELISILEKFEKNNIYYKLNKIRDNSLMIEVVVPGERWEIELVSYDNKDFTIEIEKFKSDGSMYGVESLEELLQKFGEQ